MWDFVSIPFEGCISVYICFCNVIAYWSERYWFLNQDPVCTYNCAENMIKMHPESSLCKRVQTWTICCCQNFISKIWSIKDYQAKITVTWIQLKLDSIHAKGLQMLCKERQNFDKQTLAISYWRHLRPRNILKLIWSSFCWCNYKSFCFSLRLRILFSEANSWIFYYCICPQEKIANMSFQSVPQDSAA